MLKKGKRLNEISYLLQSPFIKTNEDAWDNYSKLTGARANLLIAKENDHFGDNH